jgi:hypothetical protein
MRLFDSLAGSITRAYRLQADASRVNRLTEAGEIPVAQARVLHAGIDLQFKILKETVLDRTVPTLSREEFSGVLALLPRPEADLDSERAVDPAAAERAAVREALRAICHGRAVDPGLKLLQANGDGG